jgi:arsenate reductase (thioredoxin)
MTPHYNVLFLCTGNSARSIMAEAILKHRGRNYFTAYSAGSHPSGTVRPEALQQIAAAGLSTDGLRSKSWDEFAAPAAPGPAPHPAPHMDFVFTVCDNAANEPCPFWPGHPVTAHWPVPDPAAATGAPEHIAREYQKAFSILDHRIKLFLALPLPSLDKLAVQHAIAAIGQQ